MFLTTVIALWSLVNGYLATRVSSAFGWRGRASRWARFAFVLLSFGYVYGRILERAGAPALGGALRALGGWWVGGGAIFFSAFVVAEVVRLFATARMLTPVHGDKRVRHWLVAPFSRAAMVGLLVASTLLAGYAVCEGYRTPSVTTVRLSAPPGSGMSRPLRLVQLSDLHFGGPVDDADAAAIVAQVNELRPDVVVLTGDIIDEESAVVDRALAQLAGLNARSGLYAVSGNHERYERLDYFVAGAQAAGIRVLVQESVTLPGGVVLAGIDDASILKQVRHLSLSAAMDQALAGGKREAFTVLLAHRPAGVAYALSHGVDLMLCGHTHGGQLPPFQLLSPLANEGYLAGLYEEAEGLLYVSRGTGTWGPRMRLFAPREIVLVEIQPQ